MTTIDPSNPPRMTVSDTPPLQWLFEEWRRAGGLSDCAAGRDRNDSIRYNRWKGRTSDYKKHRDAIDEDPIPWEDAWDGRLYTADGIIEFLGCMLKNAFRRANFDMKPSSAEAIPRAANAKKVMEKYRDRDARGLRQEATLAWQFGLGYGASVWQVYWDRQVAMRMEEKTMDDIVQSAMQALKALAQIVSGSAGGPVSGMPGATSPQPSPPSDGGEGVGGAGAGYPPADLQAYPPTDSPARPPTDPALIQALKDAVTLPQRIMDPAQEEALAKLVQTSAQQMAAQLFSDQTGQYGDQWLTNYELSMKDARKVVRDLRKTGKASYPAPYLHRNAPCVVAREVGVDYWCPPETTDLEKAPWHSVRDFLTPAALEENKITDGWDAAAVEAAIKTAGSSTAWTIGTGGQVGTLSYLAEDDIGSCEAGKLDTRSGLVEVIYTYARYVSAQGIPQLWCTVYCPHAMKSPSGEDLYFRHYPLADSASYGFFPYRWQQKRRNFYSNIGVPELVGSDQASMKRSLDMLVDRQDLELNPAWAVTNRLGMRYKAGPGSQVPRKRPGDLEPLAPPTGNPELAFQLIQAAELRLAYRFGLMHPEVPAAHWQTVLQCFASDFLESAEDMFKQYWRLIQANADATALAEICGADPGFPQDPTELEGEYEVSMVFSVMDLDMEFVFKKLEAIGKLAVPLDRAGVIDLATLVRLIVNAIDPTLASAVIKDEQGASKAIYKDVDSEVLRMANGNEADEVESDPTASMKLKYLDNIIQGNPRYKALLGMGQMPGVEPDPRFAELLTKYQQNLQMSVKQEENKQIGRTGVKPLEEGAQ